MTVLLFQRPKEARACKRFFQDPGRKVDYIYAILALKEVDDSCDTGPRTCRHQKTTQLSRSSPAIVLDPVRSRDLGLTQQQELCNTWSKISDPPCNFPMVSWSKSRWKDHGIQTTKTGVIHFNQCISMHVFCLVWRQGQLHVQFALAYQDKNGRQMTPPLKN